VRDVHRGVFLVACKICILYWCDCHKTVQGEKPVQRQVVAVARLLLSRSPMDFSFQPLECGNCDTSCTPATIESRTEQNIQTIGEKIRNE
jgi:hypothetical protein